MRFKTPASTLPAALMMFALCAGAEDFDARLGAVSGTVEVSTGGAAELWNEAGEGMPLYPGDKVRTGEDSSAEITLDDGAVLRLGENSAASAAQLERASASFFLAAGSLAAKIRGLLKSRLERFEVRTPAAVAAVRGTEFCVEHDTAGNETTAGVFDEGELYVSAAGAGGAAAGGIIGKGREVTLRAGAEEFKPVRMRRLLRRRAHIKAMRERITELRRSWKRMPPERRKELRERFLERKSARARRPGKAAERVRAVPKKPRPLKRPGKNTRAPGRGARQRK